MPPHNVAPAHRPRAGKLARRRRGLVRLFVLLVVLGLIIGFSASAIGGTPTPRGGHGGQSTTLKASGGIAAIESGLEPWQLNAPISRSVVFPAANGTSLVVAGGLLASGSSSPAIAEVDPLTGATTQIGNLVAPLHDAAGSVLGGRGYVFGGGVAGPTSSAQVLAGLGGSGPAPIGSQATAAALPALPQARADDSAVTVGSEAYVLGGYNGPSGDAAVLATADGQSYKTVAQLPVPVRYAAVATVGGMIYVFGGDATSGTRSGDPISTVQLVDPASHHASIVGSLPVPLAGAAAVTLNGVIYLAGGDTSAGATGAPGSTVAVSSIYAWSTSERKALLAGQLRAAVADAGVAVLGSRAWLVGGETTGGSVSGDVQMLEPNSSFGKAGLPGAGSPYYGDTLLIADRGNNRLLAVDDTGKVIWTYPAPGRPAPVGGFYFPDDAFFIHHGTAILSNQEENETLVEIAYPSGKVLWSYGHPRQAGSAPGYLDNPDDAYLLKNGDITVADPVNCRVLVIKPPAKILLQMGIPGSCVHAPPQQLGSPNGDTPLADGNLLVSEINGSWIDELTLSGHLVWTTHLAIGYPSDPQQIGSDRYLVANYENPGSFVEFNRAGQILYTYGPTSGTGALNQPSLVEPLPSGVLMSNDDYNDRMVAIDPATGALVWQYGKTGTAGTAPGLLNTPDGFDLLGPGGTFPLHPTTG